MDTNNNSIHTQKTKTNMDVQPGSVSPEKNETKTRFYGLMPLILFSGGLVVVLIILKILLDIILPQ